MLTKKQIKIINVVNAVIRFFPNREISIERKRGIKMEDNIELVIKLPKGIYVASQMLNVKPDDVVQIPLEVIANGIPLQKKHGKIIDESQITEVYIRATEKNISTGYLYHQETKLLVQMLLQSYNQTRQKARDKHDKRRSSQNYKKMVNGRNIWVN